MLVFRAIAFYLLAAVLVFCTFLMLKITLPYFEFRYDNTEFILTKQSVLYVDAWRYAFYIHISSSLLVLLLGIFQFSLSLLNVRPALHRNLGKLYILLVLVLAAPSGFILGIYANGGLLAKTSFVFIAVLWWFFSFRAYRNAVNRHFEAHRANMYRSYALTLSAITLRTYVIVIPLVIHLHAKEMYTLVSWLSWVPNLLSAEFLIRNPSIKDRAAMARP